MFPENVVLMDRVISNSTFLALHESYLNVPLKSLNRRFGIDISPISISATESGPPMLEAISDFGITARVVLFLVLGDSASEAEGNRSLLLGFWVNQNRLFLFLHLF